MRGLRFGSAVVVCAAASAFAVVPATDARAAATPLPQDGVIVVPGHGWGHGRGMGQWGARGFAEQGKTYAQILDTYYSGTTLGTRTATEDIRVLVERSSDVLVTSASPLTATMGGRTVATTTSSAPFLRARYDGSSYILERAATRTGSWSRVTTSTAYPIFVPGSAMLELVLGSGSVRVYRGQIHGRYSSADGMRAINVLPIQSYLYGVVPAEMPSSWPTEAVRAQSVAARTYAIYKKVSARANGTMFDICATTSCQVYSGYGSKPSVGGALTTTERSTTNSAINATAGRVVLYDGKPILAEFSSSTGGYTAPGTPAYQRAVPDAGDVVSPHHDWLARIRVSEVEARWPQIGRLTGVAITRRNGFGDWGGRVLEMRLDGTEASAIISGQAWRNAWAWPERSSGVRGTFFTVVTYAGTLVEAPAAVVLPLGTSRSIPVKIRNTGTASWPVGGNIRLATAQASALATEAWISTTRAAAVSRNLSDTTKTSVGPGEIAEFRIPLTGTRAGVITETFTAIADGVTSMSPSLRMQVQTVDTWLDEGPNLLASGSFDDGMVPWVSSGTIAGDGATTESPRHGARALRLRGSSGAKRITQSVAFAGGSARTFTFGGWNRAVSSSGSGGAIDLIATTTYTDGTTQSLSLPFAKIAHAWIYDERTFTTDARRTLKSVAVAARSVAQTGTAYFDAIRLHESSFANASFEDGLMNWTRDGFVSGDGATAGTARDGGRSLVLTGGAGAKSLSQRVALNARRTERFALSFWHRTEGLAADGGDASVLLNLIAPSGAVHATRIEIPRADHGWTYVEATVSAREVISAAQVVTGLTAQTGKMFVDAIRLTRTFTVDPSLEAGLDRWVGYGLTGTDGIALIAREGARGIQLTGGAGRRGFVQQVALASGAGATFRLQSWSRTSALSDGIGLAGTLVVFRNTDGTTSAVKVPLAPGTAPWTFRETQVRAPKAFSRVDVYAQVNDRTGTVWFDALRLVRA